jgi:cell division protein FtsI/penicillin-binding protein 2
VVVLTVLAVFAVVAAVAVPLGLRMRSDADREAARAAVDGFASAWRAGDLALARYAGTPAADVAKAATAATAALTASAKDTPAAVEVLELGGVGERAPETARARLRVRWALDRTRSWTYETAVDVRKTAGTWGVVWAPTVLHPALGPGQALATTRTPAQRGRVLGARGEELAGPRKVVVVGLEPRRTGDPARAAAALAAIVDVDAAAFASRVEAAKPTAFVEAITLRAEAYAPLEARLAKVPGLVTQRTTTTLGRTATFARALLGSVGPATKEIVSASDGRVRANDVTGLSGLQRSYDAVLAGTGGLTVKVTGTGAPEAPLFTLPATAGVDVTTGLDIEVQEAAEAALGAATKPAALVAVRASTGDVLAVANGGPNAAGYNRALLGQYPPGSTFKVVSGYALLRQGYTATTKVPCPATLTVSGLTFKNAEDEVLGTVPFRTDFALSCNTAFVGSAGRVSAAQLVDAARDLGYGGARGLGVQAFGGSVPTSGDAVEHAADMIGQGKVLASPLTVATVSASVAAGKPVTPRLVVEPAPGAAGASGSPSGSPSGSASGSPSAAPAGDRALDAEAVTTLRELMRAVVTEGTGTALKGVPGGPVHGKTGTAEFGSKDPPDAHAWFTGYQGDVAFAVVVEGGGFGAKVAAPLAADFVRRLAG